MILCAKQQSARTGDEQRSDESVKRAHNRSEMQRCGDFKLREKSAYERNRGW